MGRIRLNRSEKQVLRWIEQHPDDAMPPASLFQYLCRDCIILEKKGLIRCARIEGGEIEAVGLTRDGEDYLREDTQGDSRWSLPRLRKVETIAYILMMFAAIALSIVTVMLLVVLVVSGF